MDKKNVGRPRVEGKKKVGLSIDEDLFERLRQKAERESRSISGEVEQAIKSWLEKSK